MKKLIVLLIILVLPVSAMAFVVGDVDFNKIGEKLDAKPLVGGNGMITHKYNDKIQIVQVEVFKCPMGHLHPVEVRYMKGNELKVYRSDGVIPFIEITDLTEKEKMEITIELRSYLNPI